MDRIKNIFFYKNILLHVVIVALIFLLTFPMFEPDFAVGLDDSYRWGLNHLFYTNYDALTHIIYPLGPLSVLLIPTCEGNNFFIFLLFYFIIKIAFIVLAICLGREFKHRYFYIYLFVFIASMFIRIEFLIVFLCIISCLLWLKKDKPMFFILATVVSSFGFFIKLSIGVEAISALFLSWIASIVMKREVKSTLIYAIVALFVFIFMGFIIYRGVGNLWNHLVNSFYLTVGYGGSLVMCANNYLVALIVFIIVIFSYPLLTKDRWTKILWIISFVVLFSVWKHSFVRQDIYHYRAILSYIAVFWCIAMLTSEKSKIYCFASGIICFAVLVINMNAFTDKGKEQIQKITEIEGFCNFNKQCVHYSNFVSKEWQLSKKSVSSEIFPKETLSLIGKSSIDCFPWEHTYAFANNLNWQPRATIGAAMSKVLSPLAAQNYTNKEDAVDYVLWHYDSNGQSLDGHYFLNDEPQTVYNLINNYTPVVRGGNYVILHKNQKANPLRSTVSTPIKAKFDEWINIPKTSGYITRLKAKFTKTLFGKIKSTLFRGEEYYIVYHTTNGKVFSYKYIPFAAEDGLWINPLVMSPNFEDKMAYKVDKIMFKCSSKSFIKEEIDLRFEHFYLDNFTVQ